MNSESQSIDGRATVPLTYEYPSAFHSLVAGAVAGVVVDIVLFPIDTVKTRLQSGLGFWRAGGFKGIYRGVAPAAVGSAPTAALFFCTYDGFKRELSSITNTKDSKYVHMVSASAGEVIACLIRVPTEIAKQRRQALSIKSQNALNILWTSYRSEGLRRGLYRGYGSTLMREIPFSLIQFPLWEYLKLNWTSVTGMERTPFAVAICGALAGGFSAGVTTPLDVAKTRIMLARSSSRTTSNWSILPMLKTVYKEGGPKGLFAGFIPRILWTTLGGAVFFGFYDLTISLINPLT